MTEWAVLLVGDLKRRNEAVALKRRAVFGSPIARGQVASRGFASDDPMRGGGVDVECSDIGLGLKQVFQHFMDLGILLLVVAFGVLLAVPKA